MEFQFGETNNPIPLCALLYDLRSKAFPGRKIIIPEDSEEQIRQYTDLVEYISSHKDVFDRVMKEMDRQDALLKK